jgi:proteasome lid subunit RPN8/RPN11
MPLNLPQSILTQIQAHCTRSYPNECCGALVGKIGGDIKTVISAPSLTNAEPTNPERRFVIDPSELNALEQSARADGNEIVGFYHSHPDCPARPSSTDLEWAWPVYSYMIVSVEKGEIADVKSHELNDTSTAFIEETIQTV